MAIDRKYGRVTFENANIGEDEPVFVFRAQDMLTPLVLEYYEELCQHAKSPQHHLDGIAEARKQITAWQQSFHNFTQVPQSKSHDGDQNV